MHYQPKLFQGSPHCYCYCVVVIGDGYGDNGVVAQEFGDGYGDGGVVAQEFADDDVVFQ